MNTDNNKFNFCTVYLLLVSFGLITDYFKFYYIIMFYIICGPIMWRVLYYFKYAIGIIICTVGIHIMNFICFILIVHYSKNNNSCILRGLSNRQQDFIWNLKDKILIGMTNSLTINIKLSRCTIHTYYLPMGYGIYKYTVVEIHF